MSPHPLSVSTVDYHTAGEPFRIVTAGAPELPGSTVAERRVAAIDSAEAQRIRALLCHEPRGHADMYGCYLVPPDDAGADLGVLFWHKDGFSTACGHGTIALAAMAVETGVVEAAADGVTEVRIDVPSGRVTALVRRAAGRVVDVTFRNVPSYVLHRRAPIDTSLGRLAVDVSFGGAIYASVPATAVGIEVRPENIVALTAIGREIKWAVQDAGLAEHPTDPRLSGCYGTMIIEDYGDVGDGDGDGARGAGDRAESGASDERAVAGEGDAVGAGGASDQGRPAGPHQRSITVFADGEVDRSPCGSGTSARMALLHEDGRLPEGAVFTHDSIIGTRFTASVSDRLDAGGLPAVVTDITGTAFRTGEHRFLLDPRDTLDTGFVMR